MKISAWSKYIHRMNLEDCIRILHTLTRKLAPSCTTGPISRMDVPSSEHRCRNGCGTCGSNWGISFSRSHYARLSLPRPLRTVQRQERSRHRYRAMARPLLPCPGKQGASRARILCSSPMGRCGALLTKSSARMSNAEKRTGAYAWCMEPACAVVVPACCASSASGMAPLPQSRARSACCRIRSRLVLPRCSGEIGAAENTGAPASAWCAING
jgi:hypothetical protein